LFQNGSTLDWPSFEWVEGDLDNQADVEMAASGAQIAVYLHHAVGETQDYVAREAATARRFQRAADAAGIQRIVYLGGIFPKQASSRHLQSRRETGEILRDASACTIELRASMVIAAHSASFSLVRDLAVKLPVLALPSFLDNASYPISICDVAPAIALACKLNEPQSIWFELPGPERLTHRDFIGQLAVPLGTRILSGRFDSVSTRIAGWGMSVVSRVPSSLSRELIEGLTADLTPNGHDFWDRVGRPGLRPIRQAIVDALGDESSEICPAPETRRRIARKTLEWLENLNSDPSKRVGH
jgi:uncharacterized protein YbjT (DUF2867 family)